jgi:hypothetical protein
MCAVVIPVPFRKLSGNFASPFRKSLSELLSGRFPNKPRRQPSGGRSTPMGDARGG